MNASEQIRIYQQKWFEQIRPYLLSTNLNVGSGHGYFSELANRAGIKMTSLEVAVPSDVVDKENLVLYDGKVMPFADNSFDVALAMYVLHHTPNPEIVLKEIKRVSAKRIILVEELYKGFLGKVRLAILDFSMNSKAGLKSEIHWGSYLTTERLTKIAEADGWRPVTKIVNPKTGFDEVLWVLDRFV